MANGPTEKRIHGSVLEAAEKRLAQQMAANAAEPKLA